MYPYHTRVATSHCGSDGRMTLTALITAMQDCSQLWMESEPAIARAFDEQGLTMVLASRQLDVARYPTYGEKLTVVTSIYECKRSFGHRNTVVYDEDGEAVAKSWAVGAFVDAQSGKMGAMPQETLGTITIDPRIEMDYLPRKVKVPADSMFVRCDPVAVRRSDIDFNRHVNNAQYVRMAIDCLPQDAYDAVMPAARLRVEYARPAHLGNTMVPHVHQLPEGVVVVRLQDAADEAGVSFASLEFTPQARR